MQKTLLPASAWIPDNTVIRNANITHLQNDLGLPDYAALHRWSVCHRSGFWKTVIEKTGICFREPPQEILRVSGTAEHVQWLRGAVMNIAESCFQSPPEQTAVLFQKEGGRVETMTYGELEALTNRVANGLISLGCKKGDAIAIDMVMTAESVAIYLGIIKAGCVVVSIADSLAPSEVEKRLRIAGAELLFTQDVILRGGKAISHYEKVLQANPGKVIVLPGSDSPEVKIRGTDLWWEDFLSQNGRFDAVPCLPDDHVNILFSSGTTGSPKAIPWSQCTPIKSVADGWLHHDIHPGEVVAWPTNLGWMMGPWLIFATLVNRAAMALYFGPPTGREFGLFVQNAKVNLLGLVPSIVKRWIETGCMEGLDWDAIRAFSSTGECSNVDDYFWLMSRAGNKPVIEYCGGTEIGGGYITGTMVQPAAPATFTTPALGLDFILFEEDGKPSSSGGGEVFLLGPSIGLSQNLLNHDHHKVYYEGTPPVPENAEGALGTLVSEQYGKCGYLPALRRHGDQITRLGGNYYRADGRVDDTMNLGGIKVSSAEIERTLEAVEAISESAAIAIRPEGGGPDALVIFAVKKAGSSESKESLLEQSRKVIKERLNPLFRIHALVVVDSLPRTASNKVMRRMLRGQYRTGSLIG